MRVHLFAIGAAALVVSAQASACASLHLPDAVLFDRPPARRPPGYTIPHVAAQARGV